jgi:hypothetical protein
MAVRQPGEPPSGVQPKGDDTKDSHGFIWMATPSRNHQAERDAHLAV